MCLPGRLVLLATIAAGSLPLVLNLHHWYREDDYLYFYAWRDAALWDLPAFFQRGPLFFWRPLQAWMSCLAWRLAGFNVVLINLFLCTGWVVVLWLLAWLARVISRGSAVSAVVSAAAMVYFSVLIYQPYYWFSLAGELIGTILILVAFLSWFSGRPGTGNGVAAVLVSVAMLGRESLASVLLVFGVAWALFPERRVKPQQLAVWLLPLLILAVTLYMNGRSAQSDSYQRAYRIAAPGHWAGNLLRLLTCVFLPLAGADEIWPTPLHSVSRQLQEQAPMFGLLVLVLLLWMRRDRGAWLATAWVIAALLPFVPAGTVYPRYLHFASLGSSLLLGLAGERLAQQLRPAPRTVLLVVALGLYLVALGSSYLVVTTQTLRQEYGRRLYYQLCHLRDKSFPAAIVIRDLPPEMCNRGLGLQELAWLVLGRDDVWVFLQADLEVPEVRSFLEKKNLPQYFLTVAEAAELPSDDAAGTLKGER